MSYMIASRRSFLGGVGSFIIVNAIPKTVIAQPFSRIPPVYGQIAKKHGIPVEHLYTLAYKESYDPITRQPCPYALNLYGTSYYFSSREELYSNAKYILDRNIELFDIGPLQVNWKWHQEKFSSLREATDPIRGLEVGAKYFREQYERFDHDWFVAAGKYHNLGNNKHYSQYKKDYEYKFKKLGFS